MIEQRFRYKAKEQMKFFSDRENPPPPRAEEHIGGRVWEGLRAEIEKRLQDGSFALEYPKECPDGGSICAVDEKAFWNAAESRIPDLPDRGKLFRDDRDPPDTSVVLDLVEFCFAAVGKPESIDYHSFFGHHHIRFDEEAGQEEFLDAVNTIFRRNSLAFELETEGSIRRLHPPAFEESLQSVRFQSGDAELDKLLEMAQTKFRSPEIDERREAVEKLWDAWERMKTIEPGKRKNETADLLLNRIADDAAPEFRKMLGEEAGKLTKIGNNFRIRHSETDQESLVASEHVDYLFYRLYSFIHMALKMTGRLA